MADQASQAPAAGDRQNPQHSAKGYGLYEAPQSSRGGAVGALTSFGRQLSGDYSERYRLILDEAFRVHAVVLNAQQLRDIAGGGTHPTAQAAISSWLRGLHAKATFTMQDIPGVPDQVRVAFEELAPKLFGIINKIATEAFEAERGTHQARLLSAQTRIEELEQELGQRVRETKDLQCRLDDASTQLDATRSLLATANEARTELTSRCNELAQKCAETVEEMNSLKERHQQDSNAQEHRHQREIDGLQRQSERAMAALQSELANSAGRLQESARQASEATLGEARARRDLQGATQLAAEHALAKDHALAELARARDEAKALELALTSQLAAAHARAVDLTPLVNWIANGASRPIPAMDATSTSVAQLLTNQQEAAAEQRAAGAAALREISKRMRAASQAKDPSTPKSKPLLIASIAGWAAEIDSATRKVCG